MPDSKTPDDLSKALQAKLESEGEPVTPEMTKSFYVKQPLGQRKTVKPSQRLADSTVRRENRRTNLDKVIKSTLEGNLPIYFNFPNVSKAHSLRTMISSYLNQTLKSRIVVRIGRPTVDDSLVIVGVFDRESAPKNWLKRALEVNDASS